MKKGFVFLSLAFLLIAQVIFCQNSEKIIRIGTGNSTSTDLPFSLYNRNSWSQCVYYAREIGVAEGLVLSIKYFSNFYNTLTVPVRIYMANSSISDLSEWLPEANFSLVFEGNYDFTAGQNEITFTLDKPFKYEGDNLVIMTHKVYDNNWTAGMNFRATQNSNINRSRFFGNNTEFSNTIIPVRQPANSMSRFPNIELVISENIAPAEVPQVAVAIPAVPAPATEVPAVATPVVETPTAVAPVVETPAFVTPVVETPTAVAPVAATQATPTPAAVAPTVAPPVSSGAVHVPFSTSGNYLTVFNGTGYIPFFVKGINLGASVPGSWPGQLAINPQQYARWFAMMADAGFNTVYIYTLHQPRFYHELARHNMENPEKQLYLFQGVWLPEEYTMIGEENDLFSHTVVLDSEIRNVIDCIHGRNSIRYRIGGGFGEYTTNVSQWVLGYIIGREIHAAEVDVTNSKHFYLDRYMGSHLSIENASPTEIWLTERLDRLIAYEKAKYNITRPVACSSWPTLDPLRHPSEPEGSGEDDMTVDMNKVKIVNAPGGFFHAYHVYPYFPNFMNNEEKFKNTRDEEGINNFLGYLRELRNHYTNHPLLITEFGVATSIASASTSISGMNHGAMTEEQQGLSAIRMLKSIYDSGCGGGSLFSWKDEWYKTTWITNPLTSERRNLWHNLLSPENNFGLIRFAPNPNFYRDKRIQPIILDKFSRTEIWHDFVTFNIDVALSSNLNANDTLWIAIDTYLRHMGESVLPNGKKLINNRAEFLLRITSDSANLYVTKAYDLYGLPVKLNQSDAYKTTISDGAGWNLLRWRCGSQEPQGFPFTQDIGKLAVCKGNETLKAHHAVHIKNNGISIRIPWALLNFSDPSNAAVIDDDTSQEICNTSIACRGQYLNSLQTDGIALTMIYNDMAAELPVYTWTGWEVNSDGVLDPRMFIEVEKESLGIIREGLKNASFAPK